MSLANITTIIIAIGAGNLAGSLLGSYIVKRFGLQKTFKTELMKLVILYVALLFVHHFWMVEVLLTIIYVNNGFIFHYL